MDSIPVDLLRQIHPVYGGAIGFGVWVLFQVWRAWREFRKEQQAGKVAAAQSEAERHGRLTSGFATLDASRDGQITSLHREIERLQASLEDAVRRHREEMERLDRRLAAKADALLHEEEERGRLAADRDRGWDLVRECDEALHTMRHHANDRIEAAYAAGKFGRPIPEGFPALPPLHTRAGKPPG